jgi:thioredoxin 1
MTIPRRLMTRLRVLAVVTLLSFVATSMSCAAEKAKPDPPQLPRLVDLGAHKCIPCKKMAPILEELREEYAGIVDVVFLDVWKDPKAGKPYRIRLIPTQIFFDRSGKEVFRHEGFMPKEDIEKVFREKMGVKAPVRKTPRKVGLAPWPSAPDSLLLAAGGEGLMMGAPPDDPPYQVEIVFTTVACACVMERCERLTAALREMFVPYGADLLPQWIDRAAEPDRADALLATWGLEELPALALVDGEGRPYYGDDEELDLALLKAWIERRI